MTEETEKKDMADDSKSSGSNVANHWIGAGLMGAAGVGIIGGIALAVYSNSRNSALAYQAGQSNANMKYLMAEVTKTRENTVGLAFQAQKDYYTPRTSGHPLFTPWDGYGYGQGNGSRYGTVGANSPISSVNSRSTDGSLIQ